MQKLLAWLKDQFSELKNHRYVLQFQKEIYPILQDFLLTGPTLVGYIFELWLRAPHSLRFHLALQSFAFFLFYLVLLLLSETISYLLDDEKIILYIRSFLAFSYLSLGIFCFYRLRQGKPVYFKKFSWYQKYLISHNIDENTFKDSK